MILLTLLPKQADDHAPPAEARAAYRRAWPFLVAILAGYLLFAHGCHGDEDNELFARAALTWHEAALP